MPQLYVPRESGVAVIDGVECSFREGVTTVEEGSAAYTVMAHILRPLEIDYPAPAPKSGPREKVAEKA